MLLSRLQSARHLLAQTDCGWMRREHIQCFRAFSFCLQQIFRCKKRRCFRVVAFSCLLGILDLRVQTERLRVRWEDIECV